MDIRNLVEKIVEAGDGVYSNDAGNGSGGPGYYQSEELERLLETDAIDDYDIVDDMTWDSRSSHDQIIRDTLSAHNDIGNPTVWILAERVEWTNGCQNNPYRHYLLLWEY